eukprot:SAG31_NODE_22693_length_520_cov_0.600950_1_plen_22_part_10
MTTLYDYMYGTYGASDDVSHAS